MADATYRVINRTDNKVQLFTNPLQVGRFLRSKSLKNYIVIKSDNFEDSNDRVIFLYGRNMFEIARRVENG